ncbi:MAG: cytochrome c peroxidase, partial [Woeseiaceae bacterium]
ELHDWRLTIESADGRPVQARQLVISGGMPGHGHGFPSEPRITRYLGDGAYLIEGMKFNMGGLWQIVIGVTGPRGPDSATFEWHVVASAGSRAAPAEGWSAAETALLESLWIGSLAAPPRDASNRFSRQPAVAELGKRLFFDRGLSSTGTVSCSSCHDPDKYFADGKRVSVGTGSTTRNAPSLLGASYHKWFYWDGRRDSLWAQALTPMESVGEMENTRVNVVRYVLGNEKYASALKKMGGAVSDFGDESRFPPGAGPYTTAAGKGAWYGMRPEDREAVNRAFSDIGKIIAAYVETLQHAPSRFDSFVEALLEGDPAAGAEILTHDEQQGLRLFLDVGRTHCLRCHNGPLFTNFGFHNVATAMSDKGLPDFGRMAGLQAAMVDEFNCRGKYSDARDDRCLEIRFATEEHNSIGAFKVPGLRDVADTAPYLHDGRLSDLEEVVRFYMRQPEPELEPHELLPLTLSDGEVEQMVAFLRTLSGTDSPK